MKPIWSVAVAPKPVSVIKRILKDVPSPVPGRGVTTPWGKKPKDRTYWQARGRHTGDDYAANEGEKVVAVRDGSAFYRGYDSVLGNVVLLYADNGKTYWYCHLSAHAVPWGPAGRVKVSAGDTLGRVGQTGSGAKGPHLHFERRNEWTTSWSGKDVKPTW